MSLVEIHVQALPEVGRRIVIAFVNELEARGHTLRLGDTAAMDTGQGWIAAEIPGDDHASAVSEVNDIIAGIPGAAEVMTATSSQDG